MIPRYTREEIGAVWTQQRRMEGWLKVELAATDAWAAIGSHVLRMTPENHDAAFAAVDVQRTLCLLTVQTIADAVETHCRGATEALVCGGGALNVALMRDLGEALQPRAIERHQNHRHDDDGQNRVREENRQVDRARPGRF